MRVSIYRVRRRLATATATQPYVCILVTDAIRLIALHTEYQQTENKQQHNEKREYKFEKRFSFFFQRKILP